MIRGATKTAAKAVGPSQALRLARRTIKDTTRRGLYRPRLSLMQVGVRTELAAAECDRLGYPPPAQSFPDPIDLVSVATERYLLSGYEVLLFMGGDNREAGELARVFCHRAIAFKSEGTRAWDTDDWLSEPQGVLDTVQKVVQSIANRRTTTEVPKFPGRPPYGYCVRDGRIIPDRDRQEYVTQIFQRIRGGSRPSEIILDLRNRVSKNPLAIKSRRDLHWDHTKIERILGHASLYCRGEYLGHHLTHLAFLPSDWEDTHTIRKESA